MLVLLRWIWIIFWIIGLDGWLQWEYGDNSFFSYSSIPPTWGYLWLSSDFFMVSIDFPFSLINYFSFLYFSLSFYSFLLYFSFLFLLLIFRFMGCLTYKWIIVGAIMTWKSYHDKNSFTNHLLNEPYYDIIQIKISK